MQRIVTTLAAVRAGEAVTCRNLTMFPLLGGAAGDPTYRTLQQAVTGGTVSIREMGRGGSVPRLRLQNRGQHPVLLLDGEELLGAQQNRVLNLTIMAPAGATVVIPVSCVESGRWHAQTEEFAPSGRAHFAEGRARRMAQVTGAMRATGSHHSDQGQVWQEIAEKSRRMGAHSPTSAMAAMYDGNRTSLETFVKALKHAAGQAGAVFAVNGAVIGLELFDYPATCARLLPTLVRSYALDALDRRNDKAYPTDSTAVPRLLEEVSGAAGDTFKAVGMGEDLRLTGTNVIGGALLVEGRLVHLSAFMKDGVHRSARGNARATRGS